MSACGRIVHVIRDWFATPGYHRCWWNLHPHRWGRTVFSYCRRQRKRCTRKRISLWNIDETVAFSAAAKKFIFHIRFASKKCLLYSVTLLYALFKKKKSVAPCKHWIQRCEINIALLKSTTLSHSKDSQPSLSTKVEESTFRILTQLTLPWHNTPLWRWNERFKHLDVRLKQNGTVNKCM